MRDRWALAENLLRAGDSGGAVQQIELIRKHCDELSIRLDPYSEQRLRDTLALAYLRLGEQENCVQHHTQNSCIFPIAGSGIHTQKRGAEGAIRELTVTLQRDPQNWLARWLLNIAYMQLGRWPQDVPPQWVAPPSLFQSDYDIGRFPDVAGAVGVGVTGHAGGAIMEDFDGDGLLDLMISSSGPLDQLRFFHNNGDGTFTDRTKEAGLHRRGGRADSGRGRLRQRWASRPAGAARRLVAGARKVSHVAAAQQWRRHFRRRDQEGGACCRCIPRRRPRGRTSTTTAGSICSWGMRRRGRTSIRRSCSTTITTERLAKSRYPTGWRTWASSKAWPGATSTMTAGRICTCRARASPICCFATTGRATRKHPRADRWKFTDVTAQAGVAEPIHSFATWFFDYDNDGWPDLFVAGYYTDTLNDVGAFELGKPNKAETPRLYHNNHDGTFTDVTKQVHLDRAILAMGAGFGDLDNDGWLDIYLGTGASDLEALLPNRMFRNDGGKNFQDVTTSGGFGHLAERSRGGLWRHRQRRR